MREKYSVLTVDTVYTTIITRKSVKTKCVLCIRFSDYELYTNCDERANERMNSFESTVFSAASDFVRSGRNVFRIYFYTFFHHVILFYTSFSSLK